MNVDELLTAAGRETRLLVRTTIESATDDGSAVTAATLTQQGRDEDLFDGAWITTLDPLDQRRVAPRGFSSTGVLRPIVAFETAPEADSEIIVSSGLPPFPFAGSAYSLLDAVNDGLEHCLVKQRVRLQHPEGVTSQNEFELPDDLAAGPFFSWERLVSKAEIVDTTLAGHTIRQNLNRNGYGWRIEDDNVLHLSHSVALLGTVQLWITALLPHRHDYTVDDRAEVIAVEDERAVSAVVWRIYRELNSTLGAGKYSGEELAALDDFNRQRRKYEPNLSARF